MSFPSSGSTSIFRNPIEEVARFFNTKHADHYLIFNCCRWGWGQLSGFTKLCGRLGHGGKQGLIHVT
jgi:hypothetical protein